MKYELGDVFSLGKDTYMVSELATYMEIDYLLLNKLDNEEEPTDELFVYKIVKDGLVLVSDEKVLEIILPVFTNKLQRDINIINNENKYNIN